MSLKVGIVGLPNVGPSYVLTEKGILSSTFGADYGGLHSFLLQLISEDSVYVA